MKGCAFRLYASCADRSEAIWRVVERSGGWIECRGDCIDFVVREEVAIWLILAYPELERRPDLDYIL